MAAPWQSVHYETFTGTRNRWGDYSATVIDPSDDEALMTLQEYSPTDSPTPPAESDWDEYPDRYALMWARTGGTAVPEITSQPTTKTIAPGGSATFTLGAGFASGAHYQWYFQGIAVSGNSLSNSITIAGADAADLGKYQCRLTSAAGLVLWSNVAKLKFTTGNPGVFSLSNFGPDGDGYYAADEQPAQFGSRYGPATDTPLTAATSEISRLGGPLEIITVQDNTPRQAGLRAFLRIRLTLSP